MLAAVAAAGGAVDALAVVGAKAAEPGVVAAAARLGVPLRGGGAGRGRRLTRSAASVAATGVGSASEAAALAAAGPQGAAGRAAAGGGAGDLRGGGDGGVAMAVHFIGAGPGAADLLTLRGRDLLARCPVCLYAGSIVPREMLAHCPEGARLVDTAPLALDEIVGEMAAAHGAGLEVARLHSGDLSVWSAVAEQARRLEGLGIPYTLTPGVPAFAAAAAALGRELTIPEVAQSLVLTRVSGRASAMPAGETLAGFGATGATLAIHLAIHALERVVAELAPLYGADCPVAIVARASWPEERIVRGTLGDDRRAGGGGADRPDGGDLRGAGAGGGGVPRERALRRGLSAAVPGAGGVSLGEAIGRLAPELPEFAAGEVWLAGAGPGSLGCLTLEVVAALAAADAVVYDALVAPECSRSSMISSIFPRLRRAAWSWK